MMYWSLNVLKVDCYRSWRLYFVCMNVFCNFHKVSNQLCNLYVVLYVSFPDFFHLVLLHTYFNFHINQDSRLRLQLFREIYIFSWNDCYLKVCNMEGCVLNISNWGICTDNHYYIYKHLLFYFWTVATPQIKVLE